MYVPDGWKLVPVEPTYEMQVAARQVHYEQEKAYRAVRTAIDRGDLVRPKRCSKCGRAPKARGRAAIHAHHHDYRKPLAVEWLCAKCHRAITPYPQVSGGPSFS